jgi:hypothetical protein
MTANALPTQPAERIVISRLVWAGPLAIVAAIVANIVIQQIAVAVLQPDPQFMPLTLPVPIVFTLVGVLGAVIVYALVARFASRPVRLFRRIALVTLLISFIPDILMLITDFNPGTTFANVVVLMLMHVIAWAISVGVLTKLTRA